MEKEQDILSDTIQYQKIEDACHRSIEKIVNLVGKLYDDSDSPEKSFLTFLITNGDNMIGFNGGKDLFYSTYKTRCPERDTCPSFAQNCEAPTDNNRVNHLIFSSEPLSERIYG